MWNIVFTKKAEKDKSHLKESRLDDKAISILMRMSIDPFIVPPSYEKLVGDLQGYYSRRINIQHRLVYRVNKDKNLIVIHSMWNRY